MRPAVAAYPKRGSDLRIDRQAPAAARTGDALGRGSGFPWLRLGLGCGAVVSVLAYSAQRHEPLPAEAPRDPVQLSPASAPPPVWTTIARPLAIYGIDGLQLKALPVAFEARRDGTGSREDSLTFGAFAQDGESHVHLAVHRALHPEPHDASLFVEIARRASRAAGVAVVHSTPAEGLSTKFGVVETSDVTLSGVAERTCIGFRFAHKEVGFRLSGWTCPPMGKTPDRQELACTLDRLSLAEAGNDEQLKELFAEADRQRLAACAPAPIASVAPPSRQSRAGKRSSRRQAKAARPQRSMAARKAAATAPPMRRAERTGPGDRG